LTSFSKVHMFGLTLFLQVSVFVVWIFFFYFPFERAIQQEKAYQYDLEKLYKTYKQSFKDLEYVETENDQLSVKFKKFVLAENGSKNRLDSVLSLLKKNNLYCIKFNPYQHKQKEFYNKDYFLLRAKGKFSDVISFLNELEKSNCIAKFKDTKFERKGKSNILFDTKIRVVKFLKSV